MIEQRFPKIVHHIESIKQAQAERIRREREKREAIEREREVRREDFQFLTKGDIGEAIRQAKKLLSQVSSSKVTFAVTDPKAFPTWDTEIYALLFWNFERTVRVDEFEWDQITIHLIKDQDAKITGLKFPHSTSGLEKDEIINHLDLAVVNPTHVEERFWPSSGAFKEV